MLAVHEPALEMDGPRSRSRSPFEGESVLKAGEGVVPGRDARPALEVETPHEVEVERRLGRGASIEPPSRVFGRQDTVFPLRRQRLPLTFRASSYAHASFHGAR